MSSLKKLSAMLIILFLAANNAYPDQSHLQPFSEPVGTASLSEDSSAFRAMAGLLENMDSIRDSIENEKRLLIKTSTEEQRLKVEKEINSLSSKLESLQKSFESIATGIDVNDYESVPQSSFDWKQELQDLFTPIIQSMKNMSSRPRDIEKNKNRLNYLKQKEVLTKAAIKNLESRISASGDKHISNILKDMKKKWEGYLQQITSAQSVAKFQIEEKTKEGGSLLRSIQTSLEAFFKTRGKNLLLSAFGSMLFFLSMRFLSARFERLMLRITRNRKNIYFRFSCLAYQFMTIVGAVSAAIFILYALGDWTLFGLAILFLLSMAWTAKQTLPKYWVETKMMLNLGTVKEGERVIYKGVPWKVSSLGFFTVLSNPELTGGEISLPLSKLADMNSRACHPDEPWFPCRRDDWVTLSDGTTGKVILQSPETVQLWLHGGSVKTYHTETFLGLSPLNISKGFLVVIYFGLDYRHQEDIIESIPSKIKVAIMEGLEKDGMAGEVKSLKVEFARAEASSLDLALIASFSGLAAENQGSLIRLLNQLAVDACTRNGWSIPFPQLTVHKA